MKSDIPKFSCNNTSMAASNQIYSDRYLTRQRTVRMEKNISQNMDHTDDDILLNNHALEDRLLCNQSVTVLNPPVTGHRHVSMSESCYCKRGHHHLCFESRFRHLSHQTRLGIPLDPDPSHHFCGETFFLDPDTSCECYNSINNEKCGSTVSVKVTKSHNLEMAMARKLHSRNLMLNPSVLGMVVM